MTSENQTTELLKRLCSVLSIAFCAISLSTSACKPRSESSQLSNIYIADESSSSRGNTRRHPANVHEANWTVEAAKRGCSGILISPTQMLLNAHCNAKAGDFFRSGRAAVGRGVDDIKVSKVLELGSPDTIDYALLEITWLQPMDKAQTFPPLIAQSPDDVLFAAGPDEGDPIFTVGFPADKSAWGATYAEGQAKALQSGGIIRFNIGVINGNSGGGIIKKDNNMLLGLVKGGVDNKGEAGWDRNDPNNAETWNSGVAIWEILKVSKVLRTLYPNGRHQLLKNQFVPRTQLYLGIESLPDGERLWVSAGYNTEKIVICDASVVSCQASTAKAEILTLSQEKSDRRRFQSKAQSELDQRSLQLLAYDAKDNIIAKRRVKLIKVNK